jgi:hypothetical protein
MDGTAAIHSYLHALASVDSLARQRMQHGQLLRQPLHPALIALGEQLPHKRLVVATAGEIPAAPQTQGLVQRPLELPMALLHVAVLVRLRRVNRLAL